MGSQGAHGAGGQPAVPQGTGTVPAAAPGGRRHWSLVPGSVIFPGPLPDVGRWCQQGWEVGGTWVRDQGGIPVQGSSQDWEQPGNGSLTTCCAQAW